MNHYISKRGVISRRKAEELIKNGNVKVNGALVREPFVAVQDRDCVEVKGTVIADYRYTYILFHKPKGITTTRSDKFAAKTIIDCLPLKYRNVYPVGRLDKNSSGLIILTNDGALCYALTHPKFEIEKEYIMRLKGILNNDDCRRAIQGVNDGGDFLRVKAITTIRQERNACLCAVIVCEGKKRHLRRLFEFLGYHVAALKRVRIGRLLLGGLREGSYKFISKKTIYALTGCECR